MLGSVRRQANYPSRYAETRGWPVTSYILLPKQGEVFVKDSPVDLNAYLNRVIGYCLAGAW